MAKSKRDELATLINLSGLPKSECEKMLKAVPSRSAGAALKLMLKKKVVDPVEISDDAVAEIGEWLKQKTAAMLGNVISAVPKLADALDKDDEDDDAFDNAIDLACNDSELDLMQMEDPIFMVRLTQGRDAARKIREMLANEKKKEKKAKKLPPVTCAGITFKFKYERWTGTTKIPAWKKFGEGEDVEVDIEAPMDEQQNWLPPTACQLASLEDFITNQAAMNDVICTGIKDCLRQMRESNWGDVPDPKTVNPYKVYRPSSIHVIAVARDSRSYTGVSGQCDFEEEHGVGLLFHNRRVIAFGYSDQATDCWPALEDGGKHEGFVPESNEGDEGEKE